MFWKFHARYEIFQDNQAEALIPLADSLIQKYKRAGELYLAEITHLGETKRSSHKKLLQHNLLQLLCQVNIVMTIKVTGSHEEIQKD